MATIFRTSQHRGTFGALALAVVAAVIGVTVLLAGHPAQANADQSGTQRSACADLPTYQQLTHALDQVISAGGTGGLENDQWATIVNRDGVVCAVTMSGADRGDQWPGSRLISAQKANTANAFSLPEGSRGAISGLALSTANLYSAVQPGGSLFGLQASNPINQSAAYAGNPRNYGTAQDPLVGKKIGGVNVFGGGLALYDNQGNLVGGLGTSGDTSCADHFKSWKVRHLLGFDHVPGGINPTSDGLGDDNIIFDITPDANGNLTSASGFGHPHCLNAATENAVLAGLPPVSRP